MSGLGENTFGALTDIKEPLVGFEFLCTDYASNYAVTVPYGIEGFSVSLGPDNWVYGLFIRHLTFGPVTNYFVSRFPKQSGSKTRFLKTYHQRSSTTKVSSFYHTLAIRNTRLLSLTK